MLWRPGILGSEDEGFRQEMRAPAERHRHWFGRERATLSGSANGIAGPLKARERFFSGAGMRIISIDGHCELGGGDETARETQRDSSCAEREVAVTEPHTDVVAANTRSAPHEQADASRRAAVGQTMHGGRPNGRFRRECGGTCQC